MNSDEFQQAWQQQSSNTRLTIDAEVLLRELRHNQQHFRYIIFWRDVREVGVSVLLIPVWLYLGWRLSLPWTWYLTVPALAWIAGYMLVDRMRHQRPAHPDEPLRQSVEGSLAEVEHQIWLLRNVLRWYLLPLSLPAVAFFAHVSWELRTGGWMLALVSFAVLVAFTAAAFGGVYWINQQAIRSNLAPRREELQTLLRSLEEEIPTSQ